MKQVLIHLSDEQYNAIKFAGAREYRTVPACVLKVLEEAYPVVAAAAPPVAPAAPAEMSQESKDAYDAIFADRAAMREAEAEKVRQEKRTRLAELNAMTPEELAAARRGHQR